MEPRCLLTKDVVKQGHLVLDPTCDSFVHQNIVAKLAVHQLEGVRFLYRQLREYQGVFLNDESGLGKCYQTVALLSGTAHSDRPSLIVCPNRERMHHWQYHLDVLLCPSVRSRVHPKCPRQVVDELPVLRDTDWQYAIVDETRGFMSTPELQRLRLLMVQKYIFLSSRDLLEELMVLWERLSFSCGETDGGVLRSMIERECKQGRNRASFRVYLCTRRFILRRNARYYRRHLPLIEKADFAERFQAWKVANDIAEPAEEAEEPTESVESVEYNIQTPKSLEFAFLSRKTMTPEAAENTEQQDDFLVGFKAAGKALETCKPQSPTTNSPPRATPLHSAGSEPLFDLNETNTEQMPALRCESDTPSPIPEGGINIPETATDGSEGVVQNDHESAHDSEGYLQFGQQVSCGSTSTQPVLADERYRFPVEKFFPSQTAALRQSGRSQSVESIPNGQAPVPMVTTISSSDSPPRGKSPPLFEETDNDTLSMNSSDDETSWLKPQNTSPGPHCSSPSSLAGLGGQKVLSELRKPRPRFSTPIAKLMFGPMAHEQQQEEDMSSVDIFAMSPVVSPARPPADGDNVFEITKNDAFANRIAVRGEDKGIPTLKIIDDLSSSDDNDVEFVNETVKVIDVDEPVTVDTPRKIVPLPIQRTPPSGGSNLSSSPGHGWLRKGRRTVSMSPGSGKTTPSTSRQSPKAGGSAGSVSRGAMHIVRDARRRRRLEELFKSVDDGTAAQAKKSRNVARESRPGRK